MKPHGARCRFEMCTPVSTCHDEFVCYFIEHNYLFTSYCMHFNMFYHPLTVHFFLNRTVLTDVIHFIIVILTIKWYFLTVFGLHLVLNANHCLAHLMRTDRNLPYIVILDKSQNYPRHQNNATIRSTVKTYTKCTISLRSIRFSVVEYRHTYIPCIGDYVSQ